MNVKEKLLDMIKDIGGVNVRFTEEQTSDSFTATLFLNDFEFRGVVNVKNLDHYHPKKLYGIKQQSYTLLLFILAEKYIKNLKK